jgi:hypothetical protein
MIPRARRKALVTVFSSIVLALAGCQHFNRRATSLGSGPDIFRFEESPDEDARIVTYARINGKPARLMLDTGSEPGILLFDSKAKTLGVHQTKADMSETPAADPIPGRMKAQSANLEWFDCFGALNHDIAAWIEEIPYPAAAVVADENLDGAIGGPAVRSNIFFFALHQKAVGGLDSTPKETRTWTRFSLVEQNTLALRFSNATETDPSGADDFDAHAKSFSDFGSFNELSFSKPFVASDLAKDGKRFAKFFADFAPLQTPLAKLGDSSESLFPSLRSLCLRPILTMAAWVAPSGDSMTDGNFNGGVRRAPVIVVDTGADDGVMLSPEGWREWKAEHPNAPVTLQVGWMAGQGVRLTEICWADELHIEDLVFKECWCRKPTRHISSNRSSTET